MRFALFHRRPGSGRGASVRACGFWRRPRRQFLERGRSQNSPPGRPRYARGCSIALALIFFTSPLLGAERFSVSLPAWVSSLSFSPDGRQLAVGCADASARALETATGKERIALRGHEDYVAAVAFSPDGETLATGSYDHTARLWHLASKRTVQTLRGHRGVVTSVAFSPDGKSLATGSLDGTVKLWSATNGELRATLSGHKSWVNSVVYSTDGQWIISGSSDGTIKIWRARAAELEATLNATTAEVRSVAISPDGRMLAAGLRYGTLKIWNFATRQEQFALKAHQSDVWSVAFTPDGRTLISGDGDWNKPGQIKLWDTAAWQPRQTLATSGEVLSVACSPDGNTLATGSADGAVKAWDLPATLASPATSAVAPAALHVGAAAVELEADDDMVIAGGITPGKVKGQEGKLRAVAVVLEQKPFGKFAIVACDVLMMTRAHLDPVAREIEQTTGIPFAHLLVNCTHTHHAPSTMVLHGYGLDDTFVQRVQRGIVQAVQQANANLSKDGCRFLFHLGEEKTVGQNSRQLLPDGQIYWIGPRTNFVRATGPFDPELPVLAFRDSADKLRALLFNHSTHTIGTRQSGRRSPSFYGLAAQELETELGGTFCFLEGASGSTHNLNLSGDEMTRRMKQAVSDALAQATTRPIARLAAVKRPFKFRVRDFDEAREDEAVSRYCRKYVGAYGETVIQVFRDMRQALAAQRGQERETWLQVLLMGDVAMVGVPAEYFTQLGLDIKNRSPFRHTYIAELANDWIGYLPNLEGHKLGGYQVWTGYHSYAEPGTGERMADEITSMLQELAK